MKIGKGTDNYYPVYSPGKLPKKYIQYTIPVNKRRYEDGNWWVYESELLKLVQLGYQIHGHVDYSELPDELQMRIAQEKKNWRQVKQPPAKKRAISSLSEDYRTLHLQPSAPWYIVEAVWKALVKRVHPDRGGSDAEFCKTKEAYDRIRDEQEKHNRSNEGEAD